MATDKNFVVKNGLTVGTSEVITSAGNLTNIGAITSSGNLNVTGDVAINSDDLVVSSSNSRVGINVGTPLATLDIDGDVYVRTGHTLFTDILRPYATTTLTIGQGTNDIAKFTGSIQIGSTTIIDSSRNLTNIGTIGSGAITSSGLSYFTQVDSSEFRNTTRVSNATTPANTAGWFKIAKVVRGGGRILLSFTGGNYSPDTYVIDYYRNWSTTGSLFLKNLQGVSYITKAKIRQDSGDSNYYVEIYCASNSNGLSFEVYHQRLQGFANSGNEVYGGSLSAGSTSGTDIVSEQSFVPKGIWTERIEADYYYGDVNINSGSLKLNNTTVIDTSRNLTNIGTISSGAINASGNVGINTTNASTILTVGDFGDTARAATFHGGNILIDGGAASEIIIGDGNVAYMSIQTTDNATAMNIRNFSGSSDLVTIERTTGKVGIGYDTPASLLDVRGSLAANGTAATPTAYFVNNQSGATSSSIYIGASTGIDWKIGKNVTGISNNVNFSIADSSGNRRFDIDASGNVGIGTTSPAEKLDVQGDIKVGTGLKIAANTTSGNIGFNRDPDSGAAYTAGLQRMQINGPFSGSDFLDFQSYNSSGTYTGSFYFNAGKVGIGTSSPSGYYSGADNLVVYQATGEAGMTIATANNTTGALYFADGTTSADAYKGGMAYAHSTDVLTLVSGGAAKINIDATGNIYPNVNGSWDLGKTTNRFKDLYLSGTISSGAISANSGATNVVATFTSTDATAAIALTDNTGTVELSATGTTFGIQPNGGTAVLTVNSSGNLTTAGTISSGAITSSGNLHAGDGTDINMDASANGQLEVDGNGYQGAIALNGSAMHIYHNSSSRDLILGTNETARLTIGGTGTFDFNSNNLQSIASITATGLDLNGNADISGSLNMSGGHIYMNNFNIYDINTLSFNDPGPNEGISWDGGNTAIYESPDDLTTNSAGNLQFVYGGTRRLTVNSTGIDVNNTITTTYVDAETLKANDSGTTPGSCKLHVGSLLSAGSSAVAQLGGFVRMSDQLIIHSGTSADTVFIKYSGGNIDLTEGEVGGANPATIVNDLRSTARGSGWEDQLNLISSDGTNKWNVLVDNGSGDILRFGYNSTKRVDISTGGNVDTTGFFEADQGFRQAIPGNDGLRVYGENANQPLIRVSANAIGNNSADYGFTLAYRGDRSGNENSLAIYSDNQEGTQVEAINIKQDGTTHFGADAHLGTAKRLFFNATSNFGIGAGGHNYNSGYFDTVESGASTDALELVYYQGRGVNIGSGASKNLGAAAIKLGGVDNTVESGYMLHLASTGDAAILLEADTDNVTETDNPKIRFRQDGGAVEAQIMLTADNDFLIDQIYSGEDILFGFASVTKGRMTNAGDLTMTGNVTAYSDERLKTNIKTLDPKKTLQMRGVSFEKEGVQGSGVIAQELEKVAPELVLTNDDEMGTKSVAYGNLVGYLIETIKEQQKDIDKLKEQVSSLTLKN